tara:strand:- start:1070 stop:1321 length:252 start_codon:yes stop_codon:yes gene_type:complete
MATLGQSEDNNEVEPQPSNFLESNTFEVVLVVFGVLLTAVVAFVAVNMRRLRITKSGFLCIRMVKVAVLARPWLDTTGSSDCI